MWTVGCRRCSSRSAGVLAVEQVLARGRSEVVGVDAVACGSDRVADVALLVDVVAQEDVEVEVLGGGVGVRAEVAEVEVLAARDSRSGAAVCEPAAGQRAGAADRRDVVAGLPDVEVLRVRLQAADARLERAVDAAAGGDDGAGDDVGHRLVLAPRRRAPERGWSVRRRDQKVTALLLGSPEATPSAKQPGPMPARRARERAPRRAGDGNAAARRGGADELAPGRGPHGLPLHARPRTREARRAATARSRAGGSRPSRSAGPGGSRARRLPSAGRVLPWA